MKWENETIGLNINIGNNTIFLFWYHYLENRRNFNLKNHHQISKKIRQGGFISGKHSNINSFSLHWQLTSRNENEGENSIHSGYKHKYLRKNVIRHAMYKEESYKILFKTIKYE